MHVGFHQVSNDVDVFVPSWCGRLLHIHQGNHVLVVEKFEEFDLSDDSLGIDQILKCLGDLLDGDLGLRFVIIGTAHYTIGTMADLLYVLKFVFNNKRGAYFTNYVRAILTGADKRCLALDLFLFDGAVHLSNLSLLLLLTATRLLLLRDSSLLFLVLLLLLLVLLLLLCPSRCTKPLLVEGLL